MIHLVACQLFNFICISIKCARMRASYSLLARNASRKMCQFPQRVTRDRLPFLVSSKTVLAILRSFPRETYKGEIRFLSSRDTSWKRGANKGVSFNRSRGDSSTRDRTTFTDKESPLLLWGYQTMARTIGNCTARDTSVSPLFHIYIYMPDRFSCLLSRQWRSNDFYVNGKSRAVSVIFFFTR